MGKVTLSVKVMKGSSIPYSKPRSLWTTWQWAENSRQILNTRDIVRFALWSNFIVQQGETASPQPPDISCCLFSDLIQYSAFMFSQALVFMSDKKGSYLLTYIIHSKKAEINICFLSCILSAERLTSREGSFSSPLLTPLPSTDIQEQKLWRNTKCAGKC